MEATNAIQIRGVWAKALAGVLTTLLISATVAAGSTFMDTRSNTKAIMVLEERAEKLDEEKVDFEISALQYGEVLRRLEQIERKLERIEDRLP